MATVETIRHRSELGGEDTPRLRVGDVLSRDEFLRRWEADPAITRAELIGGVVLMPSPVSLDHGNIEIRLGAWLVNYQARTLGCDAASNATALVLDDSPQPDVHLRILPEYGGKTSVVGKRLLEGPPELVAEVCASSAAYDLHQKFELYQEAGVAEYLAVLVYEKEIRWHVLVDGIYRVMPPGPDGIWRSQVFPGLWLDGQALFDGNIQQMLAKLDEGLRSPEHQAFVEKLVENKKS